MEALDVTVKQHSTLARDWTVFSRLWKPERDFAFAFTFPVGFTALVMFSWKTRSATDLRFEINLCDSSHLRVQLNDVPSHSGLGMRL